MNLYLLWVVTACYSGTALHFALKQQWAWATFWTCYAVANVAFVAATKPSP